MACCDDLTEQDYAFAAYMGIVYTYLADLICNAEQEETFGSTDKANLSYDLMNDIYYLFTYAWFAKMAQDRKEQNAALTSSTNLNGCIDIGEVRSEIWAEFNFDCMASYWHCKHDLDLSTLLSPFGLNNGYDKGIDFMRIENTDPCVPPFKIV